MKLRQPESAESTVTVPAERTRRRRQLPIWWEGAGRDPSSWDRLSRTGI